MDVKKAKKSLGQNFLTDPAVLDVIVTFSGVNSGDRVLEIGPGRGALTKHLLQAGALVKAVELDDGLIAKLNERFGDNKNFSLTHGDIRDIALRELYSENEAYQVVANIPYYITAPIIRKLLTELPTPKAVTLLVQKEVAQRLTGGAKERSLLTVATQYYSEVVLGPKIPKEYFDPIPKVDSQLITLFPKRALAESDKLFFRLVKAGFVARRKTLFNNLLAAQFGTKEHLEKLFLVLGWDMNRRAQDLEIIEWEELSQNLFRSE